MKFTTAFTALLTATTSALAAAIISPTPEQVLSSSEPFNLTFASQRIFEESSNSIDVVIVSALDVGDPGAGTLPVRNLKPTGSAPDTSAIYSVLIDPIVLCCGGVAGNATVYVLEDYNAFGGLPGLDMLSVPVTFV
ncbi:hypothetical protein B0H17DRAFT_1092194 [Mycena rosella]|uniref:Uncharacterized protein n=1 Tax=Mycena rosella TaxID=1033263 RepID=A0AAD7CUB0_MYCRO|nr:hypothetical protein B0H17DRAFT_1092194 [Mycena rosella]